MDSRNKLIMIIDDSVMDSFLLRQLLTSADQTDPVIKFESALYALNYLEDCIDRKQLAELPDLIFLDINLPLFNGFQFLYKLLDIKEMVNCKVVMTTSSDDPKDIERSAEYKNVIGYLIKPLRKEDLMQIESLLEKANQFR
jgi:response regulator of citrate/malate metabolism